MKRKLKHNGFMGLSIKETIDGIKQQKFTPVDVAQLCIDQVERLESQYLVWECFSPEKLLKQAEEAGDYLKNKGLIRLLEGIPVGVKDTFNTNDFPTQMGSPIWKDFTPGNDARVVFYVKHAGGVIPGKTVTAEFAVHALGKTLNPHNVERSPGTSSTGSAVAVATGMVPVALGTQTAGSIVRPASFCGIYGCKPSFGLIPRTGTLKTTDSLDTIGFFTTHFEDLEPVFNVLRVHGMDYPISNAALSDRFRQNKPADRPWRIALVRTYTWEHAYPYAQDALLDWVERISKDSSIEVIETDLPKGMESTHEIHSTIYDKTLSYYFQEEFKRKELVSPIMNEIIPGGNRITVAQYLKALKEQETLARLMDEFLQDYDVMISLSTAGEAPLRNEVERPDPSLIWTTTHLPVISAPTFVSSNGLPFGVQLAARRYNDLLLFKFAAYLCSKEFIPEGVNPVVKGL